MKAIALVSFAGIVSGFPGQEIEIKDKAVFDDLLKAGYIRPAEKTEKKKPKKEAE